MVTITHFIPFREKLIETTVTNEVSIAKNWILAVRLAYQEEPTLIISLNSKTNPQDDAKISTLQLCIKTKCLILQLLHMNQNTNLGEYLSDLFRDERFVFVGIGIAGTVAKLGGLVRVVKKVDVRDLVKVNFPFSYGERSRLSLKAMACELLGFGSWKPKRQIRRRDLANEVLDEELIKFLSIDAYVCHEIAFKMLTQQIM
ncbi:Ribonuclease H-like superfamily [Arabidopsis suecica]|uniref:Ribonuclease H-like superfamily n=1 Tax=Arabidopsis suecica TaxID=45249 RepID=A0A8T2CF71_ARASU|nr:Ribonuclease H-like superfamily [Arabidopsis suecica]